MQSEYVMYSLNVSFTFNVSSHNFLIFQSELMREA